MWLKDNVKELIAVIIIIAFVAFTALKMVPIDVFIGVASVIVTFFFEERSKDSLKRELAMLKVKPKATKIKE